MRVAWILVLAVVAALVAVQAQAMERVVANGVTQRHLTLAGGATLDVVQVDPSLFRLQLVTPTTTWFFSASKATSSCGQVNSLGFGELIKCRRDAALLQPRQGSQSLFLSDYSRLTGALAVLSGGYMVSFSPPQALGLVVVSQLDLNPEHTSWLTSGLFCTNSDTLIVGSFADFDPATFDSCLQAGPVIVDKGRSRYDSDVSLTSGESDLENATQSQTFVCKRTDGRLAFGVSSPVDLRSFASFLATPSVDCETAIRLSGASTAGMIVGSVLFGNDALPLSNALVLFPR